MVIQLTRSLRSRNPQPQGPQALASAAGARVSKKQLTRDWRRRMAPPALLQPSARRPDPTAAPPSSRPKRRRPLAPLLMLAAAAGSLVGGAAAAMAPRIASVPPHGARACGIVVCGLLRACIPRLFADRGSLRAHTRTRSHSEMHKHAQATTNPTDTASPRSRRHHRPIIPTHIHRRSRLTRQTTTSSITPSSSSSHSSSRRVPIQMTPHPRCLLFTGRSRCRSCRRNHRTHR